MQEMNGNFEYCGYQTFIGQFILYPCVIHTCVYTTKGADAVLTQLRRRWAACDCGVASSRLSRGILGRKHAYNDFITISIIFIISLEAQRILCNHSRSWRPFSTSLALSSRESDARVTHARVSSQTPMNCDFKKWEECTISMSAARKPSKGDNCRPDYKSLHRAIS